MQNFSNYMGCLSNGSFFGFTPDECVHVWRIKVSTSAQSCPILVLTVVVTFLTGRLSGGPGLSSGVSASTGSTLLGREGAGEEEKRGGREERHKYKIFPPELFKALSLNPWLS